MEVVIMFGECNIISMLQIIFGSYQIVLISVSENEMLENTGKWLHKYLGRVTELWLSCYLVLLSIDSKTR